jgi:hypothetical protein
VTAGPDKRVHDRVVLAEIELYGELIIAASGHEGPLSEDEIDEVLGVDPDGEDPPGGDPAAGPGCTGRRQHARPAGGQQLRRSVT